MPIMCPYSCTISSYTGFVTRNNAYDIMLGLHYMPSCKSCSSVFCSPRLPLTMTTFSIFRMMTFFHQHFRSLIDDDCALRDLSEDSTMTSPLLCDTAYLSVSWLELLCDLFLSTHRHTALTTCLFRYRCLCSLMQSCFCRHWCQQWIRKIS